jgi:hypothetical protein
VLHVYFKTLLSMVRQPTLPYILPFYLIHPHTYSFILNLPIRSIGLWALAYVYTYLCITLFPCTTHYLCTTPFPCTSLICLLYKGTLLYCITHFNIQRIIHNTNNNHGRAHQQEEQHNHRIKQNKESPYYHKHEHK